MNGERVTAGDEHETLILVGGEYRAAESLQGLDLRRAGPDLLPEILPVRWIDGEDVAAQVLAGCALFELFLKLEGLIALQHLNVELAAVDGRTAAVRPLRGEGTVRLFEIALPHDLAAEIGRSGHGVGEQKINALSIGGRRRAGKVALVIPLHLVALGDGDTPLFLSRFYAVAKAHELFLGSDGCGDEDIVPPDDRNRCGDAWHVCRPLHALGRAEFHWQAGLAAGAVLIEAAPVRPVFGESSGLDRK